MNRLGKKRLCIFFVMIFVLCLFGCQKHTGNKDVVYEDMKELFENENLLSANIGIVSKTETDDSVSYGEFGSGVIIENKDGYYYALTAAHVVSVENAQFLVFTTNTEMKEETIPGYDDLNILAQETYESMYPAEVVYVSDRDDLAVIRFSTGEELSVADIANKDPEKGERILCVGNPQNEWFAISYGTILSGIEKFGEFQGFPSNGMKHSAYMQVGSSGGAAYNEEMNLAGITPGASLSLDGKDFNYGILIPVSEINLCLEEWKKQNK